MLRGASFYLSRYEQPEGTVRTRNMDVGVGVSSGLTPLPPIRNTPITIWSHELCLLIHIP